MENKNNQANPLRPHYPMEYHGAKHLNKWIDDLTGRGNVHALIRTLYNQKAGFADTYKTYLDTLEKFKEILGADSEREIRKLSVAIDMEYGAELFRIGVQGLKMNYQHFVDPFAPNCTSSDFKCAYADFPRIELYGSLPMPNAAEKFISKFRDSIPNEYDELWNGILDYQVSLEFDGMKLAHYYGYLAGNEILRHLVPGYVPDIVLTDKYTELVEGWFARPLRTDEWEGCFRIKDWIAAPIAPSDLCDDYILREEIMKDAAI